MLFLNRICFCFFSFILLACSQEIAEEETLPTTQKAAKIITAAKSQVGVTTVYDPAYVSLKYPNGDIPIEKGVCTDVVIRALRKSIQLDLQKQVHLDMKSNFSKYPKICKGWQLPISKKGSDYKPGDLVTSMFPGNRPHIMIVSNKLDNNGDPLVIHNYGGGTVQNGMLFSYPITGHYRVK